jgi:ubiquinone biosynthesis protein
LLVAFLRGDYRAVAEVQFRAGYVPPDKSVESFAQACRSIGRPIFGKASHEISIARLMAQLFRVTEQFEMAVQPELLLLQKTMLMAEGMGVKLNPEVNIWQLAQPLIEDWMMTNFGPRAQIERAVQDLRSLVQRGPALLDDLSVLAAAERRKAEAPREAGRFGSWRPADALVLVALGVAILALIF